MAFVTQKTLVKNVKSSKKSYKFHVTKSINTPIGFPLIILEKANSNIIRLEIARNLQRICLGHLGNHIKLDDITTHCLSDFSDGH